MENQSNEQNKQNYQQNQTVPEAPNAPSARRRFWKFAAWFVGIVAAVFAVASLIYYLSPGAQRDRALQLNYQKYQQGMNDFEAAMRADTYGGKTPQETLNMFVDALKKGDVDLASKYFALETDTKSPDYLTRKNASAALKDFGSKNGFEQLLNVLSLAKPDLQAAISPDYFVFSARDEKGIVIVDVDMNFNKYSGVWKIESL